MGYQENFLPVEQNKLGHDVEIITSDRMPSFDGYSEHVGKIVKNRIIGKGVFYDNRIKVHRLPIYTEYYGQILLKHLKNKLIEIKPDIVQMHGVFSPLTIQAIKYCSELGYRVFIDDHSHPNNFRVDSLSKSAYINFCKLFYRLFSQNICCIMPVTYSSLQILGGLINLQDYKVELVPLGADINRFHQSYKLRKMCRDKYNLSDDEILIVSSGKFNVHKDIHILIKSLSNLCEKNLNVKLLLVGNGSKKYMGEIKSSIDLLSLNNQVIFRDFVPNSELALYYNGADIGVWPGDPSITVIEAMATGLPIIIPKNDDAYKILLDYDVAVCFIRGDIIDLSNVLQCLFNDNYMMSNMKRNALKLADQELSWEAIAKKTISIYESSQ